MILEDYAKQIYAKTASSCQATFCMKLPTLLMKLLMKLCNSMPLGARRAYYGKVRISFSAA